MTDYIYSRTFSNEKWNINNPNDVDVSGFSVTLAKRIEESSLVSLLVKVTLEPSQALIAMSQVLTSGQEQTLTALVATHEAAVGIIDQTTFAYAITANGSMYRVCVDNAGIVQTELISGAS